MTLVQKFLVLFALLFTFAGLAPAQVTTGTPPFGSFGGGPVDTVNLANLNVHLSVPLVNKPGRGLNFTYTLGYDTSVWYPLGASGSQSWQPVQNFGWISQTAGAAGDLTFAVSSGCYGTCWYIANNFIYHDPFGVPHSNILEIIGNNSGNAIPACGAYGNYPLSCPSSDGSGYALLATNYNTFWAVSPSGTVTVPPYNAPIGTAGKTDTNGNQISISSSGVFTDTLGTAALSVSGAAPSNTTFSYTPPGGGSPVSYTMKYASYTVKTNFQCSGIAEYGPTAQSLVSEIDRPDGAKYTFTYEATPGYSGDVTGRLTSVTLPTGGTINYTYSGGNNGVVCADGSTATLTRQTLDGTWTYAHSESGTAWTTTQTDPLSNVTTMNFQGIYLTQSSNALETTYTCYNGAAIPCVSAAITLPITQVTSQLKWPTALESQTITKYNATTGVVTEKDEYDYGQGAPGALIRQTLTSYATLTNGIVDRPASVTVCKGTPCSGSNVVAQTSYTYDGAALVSSGITTQHVSVSGSRGNPTQVSSLVSPSTSVNQNFTYFDTGMINVAKDGKNNPTTYAYSSTYQGAYPTTITNALNQVTSNTYDINSGLRTSTKDANNQTTSSTYDSMSRPTQINYPDGGATTFTYYFYQNLFTTYFTRKMTSGTTTNGDIQLDGLGRQIRRAVLSGESLSYNEPEEICYNPVGLVSFQAYPFQDSGWTNPPNCSAPGDSYLYDALGRPTRITRADGSYGTISYTANCATATDQQGKSRQVCTDGLGRGTSVVEDPGASPHLNYTTTYTYDVLNNLTAVAQNGRNRSFVYDGLSRLTSATNPESGTTSYTYDAASNVATRIDARNITTTYSYDALNRLASKTYSDGTPGAYFYYDQSSWNGITLSNGLGRLTSQGVYNGSQWLASSAFSYDGLGRVTNNPQWTLTINSILEVPYTYDLVGDMTTYGNGGASWLTFTQSFNVGGRVTQLTSNWVDSQHPATLVSGAHYNGAGGITSFVLGNNLTETATYNGLVQPCRMNVNSSGTLLSSCTASVPSGNVLDLTTGFNYGSGDNGNVMSWAAVGQQTFNRSYTYDGVNRLYTMSAPGSTCTGLSWSYDQWANRTAQTVTGGTCGSSQLTFNSYNHVTNSGFQYDAAGNMTHDASHSYTYDAENHITKVDGGSTATYGYDVNGRRVSRVVAGVETDYIYDLSGRVVADYGGGCGATCWRVGYVYLNGEAVAEYFGGTNFYVTDHLGSTRLLTGYPTASVVECDDYYPFGEQVSCGGTSTTTHKFTGYERDAESGLDNAQARYNSSSLGRFMSPDPIGNFVADVTNPQTWNMYAYVNNNPLAFIDPTGTDALDGLDCPGGGGGNDCGGPTLTMWEDFSNTGFGPSYTMNGAPSSAAAAQSALSNPDAAVSCTICQSPGVGLDTNGLFQMVKDWEAILCVWGLGDDASCVLGPQGRRYLKVANPDDVYFSSEDARINYTMGLSGRLAQGYFLSAVVNMALADTGAAVGALPTMNIAVGPGQPFHVAYGVGDTWLNALGNFFSMTVTRAFATQTAESAWFNISVPILNEGAVLATEGCSAWSCATAALSALGQGWHP